MKRLLASYLSGVVELLQGVSGPFPTASVHHEGIPSHYCKKTEEIPLRRPLNQKKKWSSHRIWLWFCFNKPTSSKTSMFKSICLLPFKGLKVLLPTKPLKCQSLTHKRCYSLLSIPDWDSCSKTTKGTGEEILVVGFLQHWKNRCKTFSVVILLLLFF